MARKAKRRKASTTRKSRSQPLKDLLRDLHQTLDSPSRPIRRIDAETGTTRLSVEFAINDEPAGARVSRDLQPGDKVPNQAEKTAVGPFSKRIHRSDPEFATLVSNTNSAIVFKDEEGTGADRMMTARLKTGLDALAALVQNEWSGVKLRVTEAWDENNEHSPQSLHYEARAADVTTAPMDGAKLGRLGRLAVDAGLDWVFFEDTRHIHVSTR